MKRSGSAIMILLILLALFILVIFISVAYRHYQFNSYIKKVDQGCGTTPTNYALSELQKSSTKEVLYGTDYDTSRVPHFPKKTECLSLIELAQKFSMPLYFPAYIPPGSHPSEGIEATKKGDEETLIYNFEKDGKHTAAFIESNEKSLQFNCAEIGGEQSSLYGGELCKLKWTVAWQIPNKVAIRMSGGSDEELLKVINSIYLIPRN